MHLQENQLQNQRQKDQVTTGIIEAVDKCTTSVEINWRMFLVNEILVWKLNPSSRTITLTKLLIKHAKFHKKETEIGA